MRCNVYIDGFNLFYGRLSKTHHKWLDLSLLSDHLARLCSNGAATSANHIRYYTSPIRRAFSTAPDSAPKNQNDYLTALQWHCGERLSVYSGAHSSSRVLAYDASLGAPPPGQQAKPSVLVWKLEEKRVDVKIACDMIRDACTGAADLQILISNDEDLEPAVSMIGEMWPAVGIWLIPPSKKKDDGRLERPPNKRLAEAVGHSKIIPHISDDVLSRCLLPDPVKTRKRHISSPEVWRPKLDTNEQGENPSL